MSIRYYYKTDDNNHPRASSLAFPMIMNLIKACILSARNLTHTKLYQINNLCQIDSGTMS